MNFFLAGLLFTSLVQTVTSDYLDLSRQIAREHAVYNSEISTMKNQIRTLQGNVGSLAESRVSRVVESEGTKEDGKIQIIGCPVGFKVLQCSGYGPRNADGIYVTLNGRCVTRANSLAAKVGSRIVKVRATCVSKLVVGVPLYMQSSYGQTPSLQCPAGHRIVACMIFTMRGEEFTKLPIGKITDNVCGSNQECPFNNRCRASAICLRT